MEHAAEFRRCLLEADVAGIIKVWGDVAPYLASHSPAEAAISLHMARCEAKSIPRKLKLYSVAWLADCGIQKIDGKWTEGLPKPQVVAEAVGIASMGSDREFSKKIVRAMSDALLNGLAKGITEPPMQKELMLKARQKERFKAARI